VQKAAGETKIEAEKCSHKKCQRCWNYWPSVGEDSQFPDLCSRCAETVKSLQK
jgi:isoleucyl-tRNA synthetase